MSSILYSTHLQISYPSNPGHFTAQTTLAQHEVPVAANFHIRRFEEGRRWGVCTHFRHGRGHVTKFNGVGAPATGEARI